MLESRYQRYLTQTIEDMFPGCLIIKNPPNQRQGIPDLLILHGHRWAALEVKTSENAAVQPNQPYYVDLLDDLSYAAFIYPENEAQVLNELQQALTVGRPTRVS